MCCVHSGDTMDRVIGMPHHTFAFSVVSCVCECVLVCYYVGLCGYMCIRVVHKSKIYSNNFSTLLICCSLG